MCLATPVKIKRKATRLESAYEPRRKNEKLRVIVDGNKSIDISLVPDAKVGDWLLCHADLAVQKIDENQAKEILQLTKMCYHKHTKHDQFNNATI